MKLKERLNLEVDKDATRYFQYFTTKEIEKNGETKMRLTVDNEKVDVSFILDFIDNNLRNIIHHLDMLSNFPSVENSIDFSENLTLSLPEEIQSMCWEQVKTEVTIHSVIRKLEGNKVYTTLLFQMIIQMICHLFLLH